MRLQTTHPERVLFPDDPRVRGVPGKAITKGDLVEYYRRVAPVMVRHLRGRPLMLERYPEGIARPGVYQKEAPAHFPDWVHRVQVPKEGGTVTHVVCNDEETLVYLANQGCLAFHAWLSRADRIYHPDQLIFDLDPPGDGCFDTVRATARHLREVLAALELVPFVKTTGSRGLHVVVPLDGSATFDETRAFARDIAALLVAGDPGRLTTEVRKAKRDGRVFVDVLRNGYAQTGVAPYSVRARPGAPVATPLDWDEVTGRLDPRRYTIANLFRRLGRKPDPWLHMADGARPLDPARRQLEPLLRRLAS